MVPRRPRAAAHASAPTSTTASPKRRPPTASSASRCGSSRARCSTTPRSASEKQDDTPRSCRSERSDRAASARPPRRAKRGNKPCCNPSAPSIRKQFKGRNDGLAHGAATLSAFGEYGLKATARGQLTAREIEAARRCHDAATSSAAARCGSACSPTSRSPRSRSKSAWARARATSSTGSRRCSPARMLFEIEGVDEATAREAFRLAAAKLSVDHHVRATARCADGTPKNCGQKSADELQDAARRSCAASSSTCACRQATGQPPRPDQFGKVRREIARVKTVLGAKQARARRRSEGRMSEQRRTTAKKLQRTLEGRVVSNKMHKTVDGARRAPGQARAVRQVHPPHDQAARARREQRAATKATSCASRECRPMSKTKNWRVVEILARAAE